MRKNGLEKVLQIPYFCFFGRHNGSIGRGQKNFLENADFS